MERIIWKEKKEVLDKFLLIFFCTFLSITMTACEETDQSIGMGKSQTISNEEISAYLNENYFLERSIDLLEIKDIVEYPSDTQNEIILTCTTVASNYYAKQTTNWKLTFELFSGAWLGTGCEMGISDCEVRELTIDELGEIICPQYSSNDYFEVLSMDTNFQDKIVTASTIYYKDFPAYYISFPWEMKLFWDSEDMHWTYDHVTNAARNNRNHEMNWQMHVPDFSGHYEIDKVASFDITCDLEKTNVFCVDSWYDYDYNNKYTGDLVTLDFWKNFYEDGLSAQFELVHRSDTGYTTFEHLRITIRENTLFIYAVPVGDYPLTTLTSEFAPQESYLQGTFGS